jgi:hypothetical protein
LATVAALNQIPEETIKQMTNIPGRQNVLENYSLDSSTTHGDSKDHATTNQMTQPLSTQGAPRHQELSFNSHSVRSGFMKDNATDDGETGSPNNQNVSANYEHPSSSATINGHYKNSDSIRKHVPVQSSVQGEILHKNLSGVTNHSDNGYFNDEITTVTDNSAQSDPANADSPSDKVISSWLFPPSGLDPWTQEDPSELVRRPLSNQSDTMTEDTSPGYYSKVEQDSNKALNWGGYEDWWAKTYANHRPYYTDEHLNLPEETQNLPDSSISIWNMESFREYESSENPSDTVTPTNTSISNNTTDITETGTSTPPLEDHPRYQEKEDLDKHHRNTKHSVKKANPHNPYSDKEFKTEHTNSEPEGGSVVQIHLTATPENILPGAVIPITESPVKTRQFTEPSIEEPDQSLTESTLAHSNIQEMPPDNSTMEPSLLLASTELSTENETDNPSHSETNQTLYHTEYSTERAPTTVHDVPLTSEPNIKRTDTQSLMTRILGTRTSTKISHETEICYRGRCIKTKTKDSDIDQFSTD